MAQHTDYQVEATATDFRTVGQTVVRSRATGLHTSLRRTPVVGDVVNDLFEVEAVLGDRRFAVVHKLLDERFELRMLRDAAIDEIISNATNAALASHASVGVIVDVRTCRYFGSYAVLAPRRGLDLSDVLADGMLSIDGALKFAISVGGALAALNEVGVTHGLNDFRDITCASDGEWTLSAAGLPASPGAVSPLRAPEVTKPSDATARSDQWVLAAVIFQMLAGSPPTADSSRGPGARRPGIPAAVDTALVRALKRDPEERFGGVDLFVDALQSNFFVWKQPSMVPVDAREISRILKMHPDVAGFDRAQTRQSVVVRVADLKSSRPLLQLTFKNIARLRREYRHNLSSGGVFVPTDTAPPVSSEVSVVIALGEEDTRQVTLNGVVSHVTEGDENSPPGAGVVFDAESLARLTDFIRSVGVLHEISAESLVARNEDFHEVDSLTADGLFLLGVVLGAIRIGELRADCSSLPFDFDEALVALVEAGALRYVDRSEKELSPAFTQTTEVEYEFDPDDVFRVIELIDFHFERRALIAAAAVADRSERFLREEPRIHDRIAKLWAEGLYDLGRARESARTAVLLDPTRHEYQEAQARIDALIEHEAVFRLYSREFPVTDVHFIGWDNEERVVWVATSTPLQPDRARVLGIDLRRDTISHSETYPNGIEVHHVWSARTSIGAPPSLFRGAARPSVVSPSGDWIFDRHPKTGELGLFVLDPDGQVKKFHDGESWSAAVSHDGMFVCWVTFVRDLVTVFIAPIRDGEAVEVFQTQSAVRCAWPRRGHRLAVYDSASGEVWSVEPDGTKRSVGQQPGAFDDIFTDSSGATLAIAYQRPGKSELRWLDVGSADSRATLTTSVPVRQMALRRDGCFVASTSEGTLVGSFTKRVDRHFKGLRLVPACLNDRKWDVDEPFVAMVYKPHTLELVRLKPELLLG